LTISPVRPAASPAGKAIAAAGPAPPAHPPRAARRQALPLRSRRRHPKNIREVDEILAHAHSLALHALEGPDTS
jgi:hypothetical protein